MGDTELVLKILDVGLDALGCQHGGRGRENDQVGAAQGGVGSEREPRRTIENDDIEEIPMLFDEGVNHVSHQVQDFSDACIGADEEPALEAHEAWIAGEQGDSFSRRVIENVLANEKAGFVRPLAALFSIRSTTDLPIFQGTLLAGVPPTMRVLDIYSRIEIDD